MSEESFLTESSDLAQIRAIRNSVLEILRSEQLAVEFKESFTPILNSCDAFIESRLNSALAEPRVAKE